MVVVAMRNAILEPYVLKRNERTKRHTLLQGMRNQILFTAKTTSFLRVPPIAVDSEALRNIVHYWTRIIKRTFPSPALFPFFFFAKRNDFNCRIAPRQPENGLTFPTNSCVKNKITVEAFNSVQHSVRVHFVALYGNA